MLQLASESEELDWTHSRDSPTKLLLLSPGGDDVSPRSLCPTTNVADVDFLVFKSDPMMSDASTSSTLVSLAVSQTSIGDKLLLPSAEAGPVTSADCLSEEKCLRTTASTATDDLVNSPGFVMDGSSIEFSLLSQMSPFPAMSSSQVSSLLSSLEPSNGTSSGHPLCTSQNQRPAELPPPVSPLMHHASIAPPVPTPPPPPPPPPPQTLHSALAVPSTSMIPSFAMQYSHDKKKWARREVKVIEVRARELIWYRCAFCPYIGLTKESVVLHFSHLHCHKESARLRCISCDLQFSRLHLLKQHYVLKHFVSIHEIGDLIKLTGEVNAVLKRNTNENKKDGTSIADEVDEFQENGVQTDSVSQRKDGIQIVANVPPGNDKPIEETRKDTGDPLDYLEANTSKDIAEASNSSADQLMNLQPSEDSKQEQKVVFPVKDGLWKEVVRWKCSEPGCHSKFAKEENLSYHKLCHEGNHFKCQECLLTFARWSDLTLHLWRVHTVDLELHSCPQCPFKTNSFSKLNNLHFRIHLNERSFLCDVCGKGFKSPKQLGNHKSAVHRRRKAGSLSQANRASNLVCAVCFRSFADSRLLRMHNDNVHKKVRPHVCNVCGHSASSSSSLKMHQRAQHTGEKPYTCTDCDYSTSDHNSLRRHKMQHSGAKLYRCPLCSYGCIQSSTFKVHLKNKHPGRDNGLMFSCSLCPFRTVNREIFLTHSSSHSVTNEFKSHADELPPARPLTPDQSPSVLLLDSDPTTSLIAPTEPVNGVFILDSSIEELITSEVT